jgi:TonB family protein
MTIGQETRARFAVRRSGMMALALAFVFVLSGRAADERAVKSRVAPVYPEIAKRMRISGVVRLEVTVNPDGTVSDVKPVSGNGVLSQAAQDAVRKWRFVPGPEQTIVNVDLNFAPVQ